VCNVFASCPPIYLHKNLCDSRSGLLAIERFNTRYFLVMGENSIITLRPGNRGEFRIFESRLNSPACHVLIKVYLFTYFSEIQMSLFTYARVPLNVTFDVEYEMNLPFIFSEQFFRTFHRRIPRRQGPFPCIRHCLAVCIIIILYYAIRQPSITIKHTDIYNAT